MRHTICRRVETDTTVHVTFTRREVIDALLKAYPKAMGGVPGVTHSHTETEIGMHVPGGADWSNTFLELDDTDDERNKLHVTMKTKEVTGE